MAQCNNFWDEEEVIKKYYAGVDITNDIYNLAWNIILGNKFNNNTYETKEDLVQTAVARVNTKLHLYNPNRKSKLYSFVYKVLYNSYLYNLRDITRKNRIKPEVSLNNFYSLAANEREEVDYDPIWERATELVSRKYESIKYFDALDEIIEAFNNGERLIGVRNSKYVKRVNRLLKVNSEYIRYGREA